MNLPNAGAAGALLVALAISWLCPIDADSTPAATTARPTVAGATVVPAGDFAAAPDALPAAAPACTEPSPRVEVPDGSPVPPSSEAFDGDPLLQAWGSWPRSPRRSDLGRLAAMARAARLDPAPAAPAIAQR
jgi:hypothetical protein